MAKVTVPKKRVRREHLPLKFDRNGLQIGHNLCPIDSPALQIFAASVRGLSEKVNDANTINMEKDDYIQSRVVWRLAEELEKEAKKLAKMTKGKYTVDNPSRG